MAIQAPIQETMHSSLSHLALDEEYSQETGNAAFRRRNYEISTTLEDVDDCRTRPTTSVSQTTRDKTKELAFDITDFLLEKNRRAPSKHAETMRRIVVELLKRHEILFSSMMRSLDVTHDNAHSLCYKFYKIIDEIFSDGKYSWGRIATVFAFAGQLAAHVVKENISNGVRYEKKIIECLVDYVNKSLAPWIEENGGWVSDRFHCTN